MIILFLLKMSKFLLRSANNFSQNVLRGIPLKELEGVSRQKCLGGKIGEKCLRGVKLSK